MRNFLVLAAAAALASVVYVAAATAANGVPGGGNGNLPAAQACKNGGWQVLVRADQTSFVDQGACISYVVQGGVPAPPAGSAAQSACVAIGGTFAAPGTDVTGAVPGGATIWTCNGWPIGLNPAPIPVLWNGLCTADGGGINAITSNMPLNGLTGISCFSRTP